MPYIKNESEIKECADMRDIVDYYNVELNNNQKAPCPVHDGDDPNFSVKREVATCFSQCGKSWGAIGFIQQMENVDYPEALERLAHIMNISVQYDDSIDIEEYKKQRNDKKNRRERLFALQGEITDYFHATSRPPHKSDDKSVVNLDGRDFSISTIDDFKVFYVKEKRAFANAQSRKGWNISDMKELFLLRKGQYGDYDHFRNRIMFPIFTGDGDIAGYSGRKFRNDTSDSPKYFNSKQSIIYNKDELLYGLFQGKHAIKKKGFAYLVEGNTDVLSMYDNAIKNVVAPCGTALTDKQVRQLKRYTSTVLMMYDGDDAGITAMKRNIQPLLKRGFKVETVLLPEGEDPDSYIRELGRKKFKQAVDDNTTDAIMYVITHNFDPKEAYQVQEKFNIATKLLSFIDDDIVCETYVNKLCKKKWFGRKKKKFIKRIGEIRSKARPSERSITVDQQEDVMKYGIYEENNQYYYKNVSKESNSVAISNFVIRPIMLIKDTADTQAYRLFEIANYKNEKELLRVDSDSFVEVHSFKKAVEAKGEYVFWGKPDQFISIKKKVYAEMKDCYPINTYGRHPAGFWAWGNGISINGEFKKVNEYGIVNNGTHKFFLPAFSKVNKMDWDEADSYEFERSFVHASGHGYDFKEWTDLMMNVFPEKAPISITFYVASLFRDIIFNKLRFFPHLNCFGAPGSGKSYLCWALVSMFGRPIKPFHLKEGTHVAFARVLSRARNGLAWFDEYKNDIHPRRIEQLKGAYDGAGREKGVLSQDNRTKRDNVNSALLISGQHQPTADAALFERVISMNFTIKKDYNNRSDELEKYMQSARGSQVTAWMQQFRDVISDNWEINNEKQVNRLKRFMKESNAVGVKDRYVRNYAILLTIYHVLKEEGVEWGFDESQLHQDISNHLQRQVVHMRSQDESNVFWDIVQYLMASYDLERDTDYTVKSGISEIKVRDEITGNYNTIEWNQNDRILALRFTKTMSLYKKEHRMQNNATGLSKNEILHYLKQNEEYVGHSKGQRFGNATYSCFLFNIEEMDIDVPSSQSPFDRDHFPDEPDEIKKNENEEVPF